MCESVVPDVATGLTEDKIAGKAFELVFAFDEVITTGGHKENITLQQASEREPNPQRWLLLKAHKVIYLILSSRAYPVQSLFWPPLFFLPHADCIACHVE